MCDYDNSKIGKIFLIDDYMSTCKNCGDVDSIRQKARFLGHCQIEGWAGKSYYGHLFEFETVYVCKGCGSEHKNYAFYCDDYTIDISKRLVLELPFGVFKIERNTEDINYNNT